MIIEVELPAVVRVRELPRLSETVTPPVPLVEVPPVKISVAGVRAPPGDDTFAVTETTAFCPEAAAPDVPLINEALSDSFMVKLAPKFCWVSVMEPDPFALLKPADTPVLPAARLILSIKVCTVSVPVTAIDWPFITTCPPLPDDPPPALEMSELVLVYVIFPAV